MTALRGEGNVRSQAVEADGLAVDHLTTAATPADLPLHGVGRLLEQRRPRARPGERVVDVAAVERLP